MKKSIMKIFNILKMILLAILIIFVIATAYQKIICGKSEENKIIKIG